ncbi:MAG: hypothetical protein GY788_30000 [bacterium]|nr:hypothetical protein [bacterium]
MVVFTAEDGEEVHTAINANDLFHFPCGVPTGFETPFPEPAVILILKEGSESYDEMISGMVWAKNQLEKEAVGGRAVLLPRASREHLAALQEVFEEFYEQLDFRTWQLRTTSTGGMSFPGYMY